jgi:hypothetical protein
MNSLGKEWVTNYVAMKIKDIFAASKTHTPIILSWKEGNEHVSHGENNYHPRRNSAVVQNSEVKDENNNCISRCK